MPTTKIEEESKPGETPLPEYRKKLEKAGIIYYNEDGEMCITPGVIPVDTIQKEIQQDIHHLD